MKKSTRALAGMAVIDALLVAGAAWMVRQVQTGTWHAPDPAATITEITRTAGGAIGIVTALLLVAFVVHRRRGGLNYPHQNGPHLSTFRGSSIV